MEWSLVICWLLCSCSPPLPGPPSLALQLINTQPVPSLGLVLFRSRTKHLALLNVRFLLSRAALPSSALATLLLLTRFENLVGVCFTSFSCMLVNTSERVGPWLHPDEIHNKQLMGWLRAINHFPQSLTAHPVFHSSDHSARYHPNFDTRIL